MSDREYYSNEIHRLLTSFSIVKDVYGSNGDKVLHLMFTYFRGRQNQEWTEEANKFLRPAFLRNVNHLLGPLDLNISSVDTYLILKSALTYMSCDFPELAESLMYSPAMEKVDEMLAATSRTRDAVNLHNVLRARLDIPSVVSPTHHAWWNLLDEIENQLEVPRELVPLFAEVNRRKTEEISLMNNAATLKLPELKRQHRRTEKARSHLRLWECSYLKERQSPTHVDNAGNLWGNLTFFKDRIERAKLQCIKEETKFYRLASTD